MSTLKELINSLQRGQEEFEKLGIKIGKLYTDHGLPPDMALDRIKLNKKQKISVVYGVCQWLIEHKRKSGATEKSIERQRKTNRNMIESFIKKGEMGVY